MNAVITTAFKSPLAAENDLFIEQGNPGKTDGYLSRYGMLLKIYEFLNEDAEEDLVEPECIYYAAIPIYVYRENLSTPYSLHLSYGTLNGPRPENLVFIEKVKFSASDNEKLKYPNFGLIESRWLGGRVWDETGEPLSSVGITVDRRSVRTSRKIHGTLLVSYNISRDAYTTMVYAREDSEDNEFSTVAYAVHTSGPTWLELEIPKVTNGLICSGGGGIFPQYDPPDDPSEPPYAPNVDATTEIDYCSMEVTYEYP